MALHTVLIFHHRAIGFPGVEAAVCFLAGVLASFQHVGLVDIAAHVDVLVAHDLSEVVSVSVR